MVAEQIVYVVDDDDGSSMSVCALVRSMGVQSESYESAEEFLVNYRAGQPGCLVTDFRMRGMNGLQLQEKLLERNIELPVILITAFARTPMTVQAMKHGAVTLLDKPYRVDELWNSIRKALELDA